MQLVEVAEIPQVSEIQDVPIKPTDELNWLDIYKVCQQMQQVCEASNGIGLSAVQVGIPWKLFLVRNEDKCEFFLNCEYRPESDEKMISLEGCLSLPGEHGSRIFAVERYTQVTVEGFQLLDKGCLEVRPYLETLSLERGIVFQHEIDHHHGILISQIGKEMEIW